MDRVDADSRRTREEGLGLRIQAATAGGVFFFDRGGGHGYFT